MVDLSVNKSVFQTWRMLLQETDARCDCLGTFRIIEREYNGPMRFYHTLKHIDSCIDECLWARHLLKNLWAVLFAIIFHDFVYDSKRKDNEEESAEYAFNFCMSSRLEEYANDVRKMILATKHTGQTEGLSNDSKYMLDIDLSGLGQHETIFRYNGNMIRREYHHLSDEEFNKGRIKFFEGMLARKSIYYTKFFQDKYENEAQRNIQQELIKLKQ